MPFVLHALALLSSARAADGDGCAGVGPPLDAGRSRTLGECAVAPAGPPAPRDEIFFFDGEADDAFLAEVLLLQLVTDTNATKAYALQPAEAPRAEGQPSGPGPRRRMESRLLEVKASLNAKRTQLTVLAVLLAVVVVLAGMIACLACARPARKPFGGSPQSSPRPGGAQSSLLSVPGKGRSLSRLPSRDEDAAAARQQPAWRPAQQQEPDAVALPQVLSWFQCQEETAFTVNLNDLRTQQGSSGIVDGSGKLLFEACRETAPDGTPSLAVHLVYSQDPLCRVSLSAGQRGAMHVYDPHGEVYGVLGNVEDIPGYVLIAGGAPALLLRREGASSLAVEGPGGEEVASASLQVATPLFGAPRQVLRMQVKPGSDLVLKLAAMLAVSTFWLGSGRNELDSTKSAC